MAEIAATIGSLAAWLAPEASTLSTIGNVATLAGAGIGAYGTVQAGKAQKDAANFEALQLEAKGKEEQAAARVEADQYRRKKELAESTLQSRAAASGFTATDPTTLQLGDEIEQYGTLQEQMAMYGGTARREGLGDQARAKRWSGNVGYIASKPKATATILTGLGTTLAARYNPGSAETGRSFLYGTKSNPGSTYDPKWRNTSTAYG